MASVPHKPGKPVIKRKGFTIRDGLVTCHGHARVDGPRLEVMFHPERLSLQRLQKAAENEAKRLFGRPFFAAQLRWHGIKFPKGATEQQLRSLLDKAAAAKKCASVPASIVRLQEQLKRDYDEETEAWEHTIANWEVEVKRHQEEEWARLETPSERADYDMDRFMEHYFLSGGQPDSAKKLEPLAIYGFTDDQVITQLQERAADVPGLEFTVRGQGPDRTMCIGWDRAAVIGLAGEMESLAMERQRNQLQAEWDKAMQSHEDYVAQASIESHSAASPVKVTKKTLSLPRCRGSFVVKCQAIRDKFPDLLSMFTMDISDSPAHNGETLRAAVHFGIFQGTAILSLNEPVLDWFAKYYDRNALVAAGRDPDSVSPAATNGKRKADSEAEGEPAAKKRKVDGPSPETRVLVRMRGGNMAVNQVWPEIQSGHLDFTDNACTGFMGVFDIPGVGENIEVEGFRVGDSAVDPPPPWNWFWPVTQHLPA